MAGDSKCGKEEKKTKNTTFIGNRRDSARGRALRNFSGQERESIGMRKELQGLRKGQEVVVEGALGAVRSTEKITLETSVDYM